MKEAENTDKYWKGIIIFFAIISAISLCQYLPVWDKEPVPQQPAEEQRQRVVNTDSLYRVAFLAGEAKGAARYKVLQRDSAAAASKDKRATEKAQHSANTYAKNKTLANCDTALTDCKEEVKAKVAVIATRDKMILAKDSTLVNRMAEIDRQDSVIDTLNAGWQEANAANAELTRKVKRRNKLLKIGAGIIAVLIGGIAVK